MQRRCMTLEEDGMCWQTQKKKITYIYRIASQAIPAADPTSGCNCRP